MYEAATSSSRKQHIYETILRKQLWPTTPKTLWFSSPIIVRHGRLLFTTLAAMLQASTRSPRSRHACLTELEVSTKSTWTVWRSETSQTLSTRFIPWEMHTCRTVHCGCHHFIALWRLSPILPLDTEPTQPLTQPAKWAVAISPGWMYPCQYLFTVHPPCWIDNNWLSTAQNPVECALSSPVSACLKDCWSAHPWLLAATLGRAH